MSILGYEQITHVDTASSLPMSATDGSIAYARDTKTHHMFSNGNWYQIPNISDSQKYGSKSWVSGIQKAGTFCYYAKATTMGGSVVFYITDNGLSSGTAVYTNVYPDTITITPYGGTAIYKVASPTVSGDKKTITANITQTNSALLNILQFDVAANGVDCRLLVLGD